MQKLMRIFSQTSVLILMVTVPFLCVQCEVVPVDAPPIPLPDGDQSQLQDYVFRQDTVRSYFFTIDIDSLAKLDSDVNEDVYYVAGMALEDSLYYPVGIRYIGSKCPSGARFRNCSKLSLKVKINWSDDEDVTSDLKFRGLKKMLFHSMNSETSQLHERLGYWLFNEMGVAAPRSAHARVYINGSYSGLYAITEEVDKRFIKSHFDDDDGNLYEEIWPLTNDTLVPDDSVFLNPEYLQTNEDENPSADIIRGFGASVVAAESDSALMRSIEQWMNIDEIITFAAVSRTIKADDGPFLWDRKKTGLVKNKNYFWYEETAAQKMHLIPWGLEDAFDNLDELAEYRDTYIRWHWFDEDAPCDSRSVALYGQRPARCDKLTYGWMLYDTLFKEKLRVFRNGPLAKADEMIDVWVTQLLRPTEDAVQRENPEYDDALDVEEWMSAVQKLKDNLEKARANIALALGEAEE